jgi:hypothetical protein
VKHYTKDNFASSQSFGFYLNCARNALSLDMESALEELDISPQQLSLLLSLKRGVAATPFELSKLLQIDTGAMTRILQAGNQRAAGAQPQSGRSPRRQFDAHAERPGCSGTRFHYRAAGAQYPSGRIHRR